MGFLPIPSFGYASTNICGNESMEHLGQQNEEQYNSIDDRGEEKQSEHSADDEGRFGDNYNKVDHSSRKPNERREHKYAADCVEVIIEQLMKFHISISKFWCFQ